ncbi:MAG TPA: hypothetical protein PKK26_07615 [Candidatus Wallbacteria bacterium]|nr:hypothetical protein [Candidatus Wallbacteria bacterium]
MNARKSLAASLIFVISIAFSIMAADIASRPFSNVLKTSQNKGLKLSPEEIFRSFLGNHIKNDDLPPGIYSWQAGVAPEKLDSYNAGLDLHKDSADFEEAFKDYKFPEETAPWIKFFIKQDRTMSFTSRGLILKSSDSVDDMELISNRILTKIRENRGIKLADDNGASAANIYKAIYNAVKHKMELSAPREIRKDEICANIADIKINGTQAGLYCETFLPGKFEQIRVAFTMKTGGQICRIMVFPLKKTFFRNIGSGFLDRFNGLLISDISPENILLITAAERKNNMYSDKFDFISNIQPILSLIKDFINSSASDKMEGNNKKEDVN